MARTTGPDVRAVLDQYCVVCHDQTLLTAGLALDDAVDVLTPGTDPETWEKVVGRLRTGTMPPGGMPRPEPSVYDDTAEWLEGELDKAWEASPRPGRIATIHRLNRTEYSNVVNDLLGLEVDWTSQLPGRRDCGRWLRQRRRCAHDLTGTRSALPVGGPSCYPHGDASAVFHSSARDLPDQ